MEQNDFYLHQIKIKIDSPNPQFFQNVLQLCMMKLICDFHCCV